MWPESSNQAIEKLTTLSNFNPLRHRNRGNQNKTVCPNMRPGHFFTEQTVTSHCSKRTRSSKKRNTKMPQVDSINMPMQRTEKCCKLTQNANAIRPGSNTSTRNTTTMNLKPGPIQETRRTRKRGKINIDPNTTLIPDKRIRGSTTSPVMIDSYPSNSNHKPMQIKHNKAPITTNFKQPTPSINEYFRLMTTTQVSSSISLNVPQLILQPNPTMLHIRGGGGGGGVWGRGGTWVVVGWGGGREGMLDFSVFSTFLRSIQK